MSHRKASIISNFYIPVDLTLWREIQVIFHLYINRKGKLIETAAKGISYSNILFSYMYNQNHTGF